MFHLRHKAARLLQLLIYRGNNILFQGSFSETFFNKFIHVMNISPESSPLSSRKHNCPFTSNENRWDLQPRHDSHGQEHLGFCTFLDNDNHCTITR